MGVALVVIPAKAGDPVALVSFGNARVFVRCRGRVTFSFAGPKKKSPKRNGLPEKYNPATGRAFGIFVLALRGSVRKRRASMPAALRVWNARGLAGVKKGASFSVPAKAGSFGRRTSDRPWTLRCICAPGFAVALPSFPRKRESSDFGCFGLFRLRLLRRLNTCASFIRVVVDLRGLPVGVPP
jgi:hypothetical protein